MNVLVEWHHGSLYYSFHLLFEKRLGWNLFRPIGYEWFKKGFWRYSRNPSVIKQYLETPDRNEQIVQKWNQWSGEKPELENGVYLIPMLEGSQRYLHRAITYEKFLEMDFDYIIASVHQHEQPFHRLAKEKEAVFIRQFGNPNEICDFSICRNIMNSTTTVIPEDINAVSYHPEFSLEEFRYETPKQHKVIKSFLNALPTTIDAPLWYQYEEVLPDFKWLMHGIIGRDGLVPEQEKAKAMREASWIWHLKSQGDGYGFVVFQSYACGRPLIVKKHYYARQSAEGLMEDSVTCIDLDLGNKQENVEKIRFFSKPENHIQICENAYKRFKQIVDFDKEFYKIKKFLQQAT